MRYAEFAVAGLLQEAYQTYSRNNLVTSQGAFSRRVLGQKNSYYSSMVARDRRPSRKVLAALQRVTKALAASFQANPHFGKHYAVNLNQAFEELDGLIRRIEAKLEVQPVGEDLDQGASASH